MSWESDDRVARIKESTRAFSARSLASSEPALWEAASIAGAEVVHGESFAFDVRAASRFGGDPSEPDPVRLSIEADEGAQFGAIVVHDDGMIQWATPAPSAARHTLDVDLPSRQTFEVATESFLAPVAPASAADRVRPLAHLRVLRWTVPVQLLAKGVAHLAAQIHRWRHPYRLLRLAADASSGPRWEETNRDDPMFRSPGPSLLFLHGTLSSARKAFAALPSATVRHLWTLYQGRVWAFDHPSVTESPEANARELLDLVQPRGPVHIVAHSRGGLVARELAETLGPAEGVRVEKAVLVATPNRGTPWVGSQGFLAKLDILSNLAARAGPTGAGLLLSSAMEGARLLIHDMATQPGIEAMRLERRERDDRPFPQSDPTYHALAADWNPVGPVWRSLQAHMKNLAADALFRFKANDAIVPRTGCYESYESGGGRPTRIRLRHEFAPGDGVHHSSFFEAPTTSNRLRAWLQPRG